MVIIEREYKIWSDLVKDWATYTERKVFDDNDIKGVQAYLDQKANSKFTYSKV